MDFEVRHIDDSTVKLISSEHKCAITSATQTRKLCGNDTVTINLQSATYIEFQVGDKITIFGTTYTLNQLPTVKKESERSYTYTLVFEGLQYTLIDRVFLMPANTQGDNLMFDLAGMLRELQSNINRGVVDDNNNPINSAKPYEFVLDESLEETEYKNLSLTGKNCLQVLQQLCQEWDTEFVFAEEPTRIAIYIGVAGSTFPTTFTYGRGGGVYELNREKGASDICTRLFVYGGTQNLTYYRHNRLCLPSKEKNQSYVEDATAQAVYGIKEQVKNFDDIYPNRIGTITSLSGCDYNEFIDSAMADAEFGFDLNEKWADNADDCEEWLALKGLEDTPENEAIYYNDVAGTAAKYLMAGATAKIHFNTGALAGYECDLHSYTHSSQKFVLKPLVDENGYDFPSKTNAAFKLAVGDEYVILDINLPTAYKEEAESKLATEAASYFETVCRPQPKYTLTIEPIALKHIVGPSTADTEIFKVGDLINISDPTGGVESATIRIDQFVRNLLDPFDYKLTLTDEITYSQQVRTLIEVDAIKRVVEESKIYDVNRIRRGWKDAEELYNQMFDTEGHYYSEKIAPLSIDTQMLKVGARSQQLVLQNVLFQPNYNANPANLQISAGSLVHYTIAEPDIKTWTMSALSASNVPSTAQYVYAKCAKNGTTGTWHVTDEAIVFDSELYPNDYHFLVGSLSSVDSVSNTRNFAATYGFTTINGRNITTGVIKSADGNGVVIDLDNNTITGNITFNASGQAALETLINNTVDDEISGLGLDGTNLLAIDQNKWEQGSWSTATGAHSVTDTRIRNTKNGNYIRVEAGTTYTISRHTDVGASKTYHVVLYAYDSSGNYVLADSKIEWQTIFPFTWTPATATRLEVGIRHSDNSTIMVTEAGIAKIKIEKGETATAWTLSPEDVQGGIDAISNLEIGGMNYLLGVTNNNGNPTTNGATYSCPDAKTIVLTCTTANSYAQAYYQTMVKDYEGLAGKEVIFSIEKVIKSNNNSIPRVYLYSNNGGINIRMYDNQTFSDKYTYKFTFPTIPSGTTAVGLIIRGSQNVIEVGDTVTFVGLKLEIGNKATDWSPSPYDVPYDELIKNLTATCDTAAGTMTKVITCPELTPQMLVDTNLRIKIKFTNGISRTGVATGALLILKFNNALNSTSYITPLGASSNELYWYYHGTNANNSGDSYLNLPFWNAGQEVELTFKDTYVASSVTRARLTCVDEAGFDTASALYNAYSGKTSIFGGLILTETVICGSGTAQAGMNGTAANKVAFWAGGTIGNAANWNVPLVIMRNGRAKFANLFLQGDNLAFKDNNGDERWRLIKDNLPTATNYESQSVSGGNSASSQIRSVSTVTVTEDKFFPIGSALFNISVPADTAVIVTGSASFSLVSNRASGDVYLVITTGSISTSIDKNSSLIVNPDEGWLYSIDTDHRPTSGVALNPSIDVLLPTNTSSKTFYFYLCYTNTTGETSVGFNINSLSYNYSYSSAYALTRMGANGLLVGYNNTNYFYAAVNSNKMNIVGKGDVSLPGVLWAGTVETDGTTDFSYACAGVSVARSGSHTTSGVYVFTISGVPTTSSVTALVTPIHNSTTATNYVCKIISQNRTALTIRCYNNTTLTNMAFSLVLFGKN